jgi:lysophospholipase L1-like esterase
MTGLRVINAGINGETSKEGLVRLPKLLEDPSIKLMILFFGGNDIMQRRSREELKQNLKTMIQLAKQKHIDVLLISVPNIGLFGLSPLSLYKEVAEEENIPLLSGMLADILSQPSLKNDQIHPNGSGYKKMAERIYETLKEHGWINN